MSDTYGLFAGTGALPHRVAEALSQQNAPFVSFGFEHSTLHGAQEHLVFRLETLGTLLEALKSRGVQTICLAGGAVRPDVDLTQVDAATAPLLGTLASELSQGDDTTLRAIVSLFESQGFRIVPAHDLVPDLLPKSGVLTHTSPSEADLKDIERAKSVHAHLGAADVGQACVVAQGQVLAVEALLGTDWMLRSLLQRSQAPTNAPSTGSFWDDPLGTAADMMGGPVVAGTSQERHPDLPKGGVLYKASKPGQSLAADLATIGPSTVQNVKDLELNGIVLGPMTQILDREAVIAACNAAGLFLEVRL
ncbi:MAG: UDP-2,3-diacylglucosamine diphosphatase LpxI [Pseudomonadota bacterium]